MISLNTRSIQNLIQINVKFFKWSFIDFRYLCLIKIAIDEFLLVYDLSKPSYPIQCEYKMKEVRAIEMTTDHDIIVGTSSDINYLQLINNEMKMIVNCKICKEDYKSYTSISTFTEGKRISVFIYQPGTTYIGFLTIRPPINKQTYIHKLYYLTLNKLLPLYNYTKTMMIRQVSAKNVLFWGRDEGVDKVFLGLFDAYEETPLINSYKHITINIPKGLKNMFYIDEKEITLFFYHNRIIIKDNELKLEEPIYELIQLKTMIFAGLGINRIEIIGVRDDKLAMIKVI